MDEKLNQLIHTLDTIIDYGVAVSNKKAKNGRIVKTKTEMSNEMIAKMLIKAGIFNQ